MTDLRTGEQHAAEVSESSRKRFARRQWARRWLAWRLVVAVLLVLALVAGLVWLFFFSSTLAVEGVEVQGTAQVTERQVLDAAAVPTGEPLARADLADVAAELVGLAAPGDLVLTLGAGTITTVGPQVLALLEARG